MTINARRKGSVGEREFCGWIKELLSLDFDPKRNYAQTADGGADILNVGNFRFEIKRCEKLALRDWWVQVCHGALPSEIPVVAFRKNRQSWRLLISAKYIGLQHGFVQLEPFETTQWLKKQWALYLNENK